MAARSSLHVVRSRCITLLFSMLVALLPAQASQAAAVSALGFGQVDWVDSTGFTFAPSSSWGTVDMTFIADPTVIHYVNIVASEGGGAVDAWIVRNMPLFSLDIGAADTRQSVDFDIGDLGLSAGEALTSVDFRVSVTDHVIGSAAGVVGPVDTGAVETIIRNAHGSKPEEGGGLPDVGAPAGVKAVAAVEKKDVIQHKNVPAVQEGKAQCLPGSLARSIKWLDQEHDLMSGKTAQQIFDDLVALKVGSMGAGATTLEQDLSAKARYLDDLAKTKGKRALTKVLDLSDTVGPAPGVREETGIDLVEWLYREMRTEDVELDYRLGDIVHIVTITSIYRQGEDVYVKFRDDETQGDATRGDTAEKSAKLTKDAAGDYFFRRNVAAGGTPGSFKVRYVVSESIPEPGALLLATSGGLLLLALRGGVRRRRPPSH